MLRNAISALVLTWCTSLSADYTMANSPPDSTDTSLESRITAFLAQEFVHGVPYSDAHSFGTQALPILARHLIDPAEARHRPVIVTTIAFIGRPEGFRILHDFLWNQEGEVDLYTFQALIATPSMMGLFQTSEATDHLIGGTNPEFWNPIRWTYGRHRGSDLHLLLSKVAINGLSYSGSPKARERLEYLQEHPYSERQGANIREGLTRHAEIVSKGLVGYLRARGQGGEE